ncbi:hypothetical protein C0Q70_18054 [Pomacea canaliculata]|uniref:Acyltransferase 3 domain-containing protein n=1 Tax=Pomacea canaliculata TaxID=400727 RepID=A0A2T7NM59_POMCA|nr:hypothetical protein C0Q70_18054 [Pomacea canaliculata]
MNAKEKSCISPIILKLSYKNSSFTSVLKWSSCRLLIIERDEEMCWKIKLGHFLLTSLLECMGFTWYLANDMQFYILSPLIFVPFYYSVKYGMIAYGIFLTATVVTPACLTVADHLPASLFTAGTQGVVEKYQHELYIKPYTRMGPYIVGMVTGYLLYHYNCRIQINKILNLFGWIVATAVGLAVVYGLYDDFEGFVNTILSWKALVPLSRLTYCVYLVHIIIMEAYFYSRDTPFYVSDENVVIAFLGLLLFSFMVAAVISIAFEAPMMALEKVLLKTLKRRE